MACTATATCSIKEEVISNLEMHACATVMTSPDRANIYYEVLSRTEISKDLQFLIEQLDKRRNKAPRAIVYCRTLNTVNSDY